ncbi:MAG: aldo/keto reductase [Acidimicrobiia bacterium]
MDERRADGQRGERPADGRVELANRVGASGSVHDVLQKFAGQCRRHRRGAATRQRGGPARARRRAPSHASPERDRVHRSSREHRRGAGPTVASGPCSDERSGRRGSTSRRCASRAKRRPQVMDRVTPRAVEVGRALARLADERGLTATQLALLWVKDQPGVTAPIIGPRTLDQLLDAIGVLDLELDEDTRIACDELVHPGNAVADFHNTTGWTKARVPC